MDKQEVYDLETLEWTKKKKSILQFAAQLGRKEKVGQEPVYSHI